MTHLQMGHFCYQSLPHNQRIHRDSVAAGDDDGVHIKLGDQIALIGREFLAGQMVVDPALRKTTTPHCKAPAA